MKSRFKVGDRVIIITDRWDTSWGGVQQGTRGTVSLVNTFATNEHRDGKYEVELDEIRKNAKRLFYAGSDLALLDEPIMPEPEYELEEIHKAQEVFNVQKR